MRTSALRIPQDAIVVWSLPVSALYFLRAGETSVYVFDIWFLILLITANFVVPLSLLRSLILLSLCFVLSLISVTEVLMRGGSFLPTDFLTPFIRYGQIIFMIHLLSRVAEGRGVSREFLRNNVVVAAFAPLLIGLFLLAVNYPGVIVFNRYAGYLSNPNYMAAYVSCMLPVVLVATKTYSLALRAFLLTLYLGAGLYSLALSGSNGGWIAFGATATLYLGTVSRRSLILSVMVAALALIFADEIKELIRLAAFEMRDSELRGLQRTANMILIVLELGDVSGLGSLEFRESVQSHLLGRFVESPFTILFGFGMGQAKWITMEYIGLTVAAHNGYMHAFLELGVIGALLLVLALAQSISAMKPAPATLRVVIGYVIALATTPALYLPFFWMPVVGAAVLTLYDRKT